MENTTNQNTCPTIALGLIPKSIRKNLLQLARLSLLVCMIGIIPQLLMASTLTMPNGNDETYESVMPADPVPGPATKTFCKGTGLSASLANTGIRVSNTLGANEQVVWRLLSAPTGSAYTTLPQEFRTPSCASGFGNFGELAVASNSRVIRVNDVANAPIGTYIFEAFIEDCVSGMTSNNVGGFSITVSGAPTVSIAATPNGDICLGTTGVMYDATVTSTDGGTYSYDWCAYNAANGGGTCYGNFSPGGDNASQTRSWTSSSGSKSVGVEVMSDNPGCMASTIYNFTVNPLPAPPVPAQTDNEFCEGDALAPNLANTGVSVDNTLSANETVACTSHRDEGIL
jgi:hypothetical protein